MTRKYTHELYKTNIIWLLFVGWYKYDHSVKATLFHFTRRQARSWNGTCRRVKWNTVAFTSYHIWTIPLISKLNLYTILLTNKFWGEVMEVSNITKCIQIQVVWAVQKSKLNQHDNMPFLIQHMYENVWPPPSNKQQQQHFTAHEQKSELSKPSTLRFWAHPSPSMMWISKMVSPMQCFVPVL